MTTLPQHYDVKIYEPEIKKSNCLIVFVPFFGGNPEHLQRHVAFVNQMGFRALTFRLYKPKEFKNRIFNNEHQFGLFYFWREQIINLLKALDEEIIFYAFSTPTGAVFSAIRKFPQNKVRGIICDSGPTAYFYNSIYRYYKYQEPIKNILLRLSVTGWSCFVINPLWVLELKKSLTALPQNIPILSLRGEDDPLIPPQFIEDLFVSHTHLQLQVAIIPKAAHLNGLRDCGEIYTQIVHQFIQQFFTQNL